MEPLQFGLHAATLNALCCPGGWTSAQPIHLTLPPDADEDDELPPYAEVCTSRNGQGCIHCTYDGCVAEYNSLACTAAMNGELDSRARCNRFAVRHLFLGVSLHSNLKIFTERSYTV